MNSTLRKRALFLSTWLLVILLISCIIILVRYHDTSEQYTAYIYQDGVLTRSIDLSQVTKEYSLDFTTQNGGENRVLVQPNGISVIYANCPDRVCVHQGVVRNSLLPITCLPHGLVIELKPNHENIDTITY